MTGSDGNHTRIGDILAITELSNIFAYSLDHGDLDTFLSIFTEDVDYSNGPRALSGMAAMRAFFGKRGQTDRVSRHLYSGLQIRFLGPDRASGTSLWLTFAANGTAPISPAEPYLVADMDDDYVRDGGGNWLIARRRITPVFVSETIKPPDAK